MKSKKIKATFGAIITLISAIYKLVTGFFVGLIFMASGFYTFIIFICKMIYAKNLDSPVSVQYKAYRNMGFFIIIASIFFLVANIITLNEPPKDYGLVFNIIISAFLVLLFLLSLKGYFKRRKNENILSRAIKILSLTCALVNLVLVEKLFLFYLSNNLSIDYLLIQKIFILSVSGIVVLTGILVIVTYFIRYHKYKKQS